MDHKRVTHAVKRFASQEVPENQPAEQSEEMGAKVCVLTGTAKYGQKRGPCHDGDEKMITSDFFSGPVCEDGQHANDSEYCR